MVGCVPFLGRLDHFQPLVLGQRFILDGFGFLVPFQLVEKFPLVMATTIYADLYFIGYLIPSNNHFTPCAYF